jgi:hypothetical protein
MLRLLSILLFAVVLAACVAEDIPNYGPAPVSPLIPNEVPVLLENQWRLTEIIHDGTSHDFDSIAPVLATFGPATAFRYSSTRRILGTPMSIGFVMAMAQREIVRMVVLNRRMIFRGHYTLQTGTRSRATR